MSSYKCEIVSCPQWELGNCARPNMYYRDEVTGLVRYITISPDNCKHRKFIERERKEENGKI